MADLLQFTLFPTEQEETPVPEPEASALEDTPPDHASRTRALDTRISCIVEAPAGSGKTGLLLQRFLKLLAQGNVEQNVRVAVETVDLVDAEVAHACTPPR